MCIRDRNSSSMSNLIEIGGYQESGLNTSGKGYYLFKLINKKIKPALDEGKIVLMDRYYYSTMAYQAAAGIDVNRIRKDNEFAPKPDIVLIFDLPADLAMKRVRSHSVADVFEKEEHLEKVREAYLNLEDDSLVRIIDATRTPEEIFDEVWKLFSEVING